jgi:Zn-finger nucleic acid-binding protein
MTAGIARARVADKPVVANCDSCGAPMRIEEASGLLVCDHCGSQQEAPAPIPYVKLLGETSSLCPICSLPLSTGQLDGHPLLCCARCFGMLIEMNRFATIIGAARVHEERSFRIALPRRQNPADRAINCPACGQPMLSHLYGGPGNVVIDSCERCQLNWLDPGELRRIAVAPDGSPRRDDAIDIDPAARMDGTADNE